MGEKGRKHRIDASDVLRVTDIIPPFNHTASLRGDNDSTSPPLMPPRLKGKDGESKKQTECAPAGDVGDDVEIPTFDLAESILAEQRRVTARRRRRRERPGPPSQAPPAAEDPVEADSVSEPSGEERTELQQVVAEIVARDIERLSRRARENAPA